MNSWPHVVWCGCPVSLQVASSTPGLSCGLLMWWHRHCQRPAALCLLCTNGALLPPGSTLARLQQHLPAEQLLMRYVSRQERRIRDQVAASYSVRERQSSDVQDYYVSMLVWLCQATAAWLCWLSRACASPWLMVITRVTVHSGSCEHHGQPPTWPYKGMQRCKVCLPQSSRRPWAIPIESASCKMPWCGTGK
jgi:hypothetical protein